MKHHIILSIAALIALSACGHKGESVTEAEASVGLNAGVDSMEELTLELPMIPTTISAPEDKAGFLAIHFWDNLDFTDKETALRLPFMEQNFVDYLSIMPAVMAADRRKAFDALIKKASVTPETRSFIIGLGEKYLNDPDSPMKNPDYYADFIASAGMD